MEQEQDYRLSMNKGTRLYYDKDRIVVRIEYPAERQESDSALDGSIFLPYALFDDYVEVGSAIRFCMVRDSNGNPHNSVRILEKHELKGIDEDIRKAIFCIRDALNDVDADFEVDNSPAAVGRRVDRLAKVIVRDLESLRSAALVLRDAEKNGHGWHRVLRDQQ